MNTSENQSTIINNTQFINYPFNNKSVLISYFFLIFFGALGLHRFYIGKVRSGLAMLVVHIAIWITFSMGLYLSGYTGNSGSVVFFFISALLFLILTIWILFDLFTFFISVEKVNHKKQEETLQKLRSMLEKIN